MVAGKRGPRISDIGDFIEGDECVCCCKNEIYCDVNYGREDKLPRPPVKKLLEHKVKKSASVESVLAPRKVGAFFGSMAEDIWWICKQDERVLESTLPKTLTIPNYLTTEFSFKSVIADNASRILCCINNRLTGKKFVLKLVAKKRKDEKSSDLRIMKYLRGHPNVLRITKGDDSLEFAVMIWEYLSCDLLSVLDEFGALSNKTAKSVMYMLASGLDFIHGKSIIHRDIKPQNILVDKDENGNILHLKIADFGLATVDTGRKLVLPCGTPYYMAPEMFKSKGYNKPVDCWAVGVVLFQLLSATEPYACSVEDIYEAIVKNNTSYEPMLSDGLSKEAINLIRGLLSKTPKDRLTAREILNDLC